MTMKIVKFYTTTVAIFVLALMLADLPAMAQRNSIKGNGNIQSQDRKVSGISGLDVSGGFEVQVTQGNNEGVRIEADENLLSQIKTEVRNGILHIYNEESISSKNKMKAYVTLKELNSLDISGGVKIVGNSIFKPESFKMDLSGASNINLNMETSKITADMSGASKVTLKGKADEVTMNISGASNIDTEELQAKNVKIEASGASKVKVFAKDSLHIGASGASHVSYKGTPSISSDTSGGARISKL